jgi:hypothetical protein
MKNWILNRMVCKLFMKLHVNSCTCKQALSVKRDLLLMSQHDQRFKSTWDAFQPLRFWNKLADKLTHKICFACKSHTFCNACQSEVCSKPNWLAAYSIRQLCEKVCQKVFLKKCEDGNAPPSPNVFAIIPFITFYYSFQ